MLRSAGRRSLSSLLLSDSHHSQRSISWNTTAAAALWPKAASSTSLTPRIQCLAPGITTPYAIHYRNYSRTVLVNDSGADTTSVKTKKKKKGKGVNGDDDADLVLAARDFNNRRAAYLRQVSQLRKSYAAQVAEQNAADQAERQATERELTRRRLERQRLKNIRSAQNAIIQEELRVAREREFQQHLERQQEIRNEKNERLTAARQLVVDILEEEAPLWMTNAAEVEAAFTPEAEQLLWSFPGGVLGAPNPSLDSHMWQHETHTWSMRKSYKTKREVLLERIQEQAYNEANMDASFWTPERLAKRHELEQRARLRADVQNAGRRELLKRQAQMMDERDATGKGDVPKAMPAPSLKMQANDKALEREGAQILMQHPERFFVFDKSATEDNQELQQQHGSGDPTQVEDGAGSTGVLLGSPVALRSIGLSEYPQVVGKLPKPDTRTDREKKQAERQERLLAAARAQALKDTNPDEVADDDWDDDPRNTAGPIDYDAMDHDSDDEEWEKGLDPIQDKALLETPSYQRYTEDDIEWTLQQLEKEAQFLEEKFALEIESLQQKLKSELGLKDQEQEEKFAQLVDSMKSELEIEEHQEQGQQGEDQFYEEKFAQEIESLQLREKSELGLEHQEPGQQGDGGDESQNAAKDDTVVHDDENEIRIIESILLSMSEKELFALSDLADVYKSDMSVEEFIKAAQKIPSLTHEQLIMLMEQRLRS
jgi:hypothetical protein